jgi:hypothetical protein
MDRKHLGLKTKLDKLVTRAKQHHDLIPMFTHFNEMTPDGAVIRATSCILFEKNMKSLEAGVKSKGISLVSGQDNGSKVAGKATAIHRALQALEKRSNLLPIRRTEALENIEDHALLPESVLEAALDTDGDALFKAVYVDPNTPLQNVLHFVEKSRLERKLEKKKT